MPVEPGFDPDDDPSIEITATSLLACRYAQYGCRQIFTYQPGERDRAVAAHEVHRGVCPFRFHGRHE